MKAVTVIAVLLCLPAQSANPNSAATTFDSAECRRYSYDLTGSDLSEVELSDIIELVGPIYSERLRWTSHLRLCIDDDPAYRPCGSRAPSSPHFVHNAGVNLARGQNLLGRVEELRGSLAVVKQYYAFQYGFWIELGTRKLDYLRLRDSGLLVAPLMSLDVAKGCGAQASALQAVDGGDDTVLRSLKDWHNCVNHLMHGSPTQAAGYPKEAWQAFLKAEGIREEITPVPDCEHEF